MRNSFWRDSRGSAAMIFAFILPVFIAVVGGGIDLYRGHAARSTSQDAVDAAVLAAASSPLDDDKELKKIADVYLTGNLNYHHLERQFETQMTRPGEGRLRLRLVGKVRPFFLGLIGITELPVDVVATATRGAADRVELALVLDNTWSMSDQDGSGSTKIAALKSAAQLLVSDLMRREDGKVAIGVVPYGDYVNVGTANRSQPWVSAPADYSTTSARVCTTRTTKSQCTRGTPKTCTRQVDGVSESYDCTPQTCTTVQTDPYETCSGGGTTWYRWYGCVASRKEGSFRLNDLAPQKSYPGILATSQNCLTALTPLTSRKATVLSAIQSLVVNVGGYRPQTYIPSGLIWGVNVLSSTAPLTEGAAYHPQNRDPRKIMVLMTDGENTLRFDPSTGLHSTPSSSGSSGTQQLRATNNDTKAICDYAKAQKIEVFTVAFGVSSSDARDMLEDCASASDHYFDARNNQSLRSAFLAIAASINTVRLVE